MSFSETIFLFFLALIIFGPKKLPEIARQVGKALNEFRRASNEFKAQIEQEISNLEVENRKQTILPPSPAPEGTAGRSLSAPANETGSTDVPAAPPPSPVTSSASVDDEPLLAAEQTGITANSTNGSGETHPATDDVATSTTQESHV